MSETRPRTHAKIQSGIVIDHILAGRGLQIAHLLGLDDFARRWNDPISIGLNHASKRGLKDYIKIENFELSEQQLSYVALVSPDATINTIRGAESWTNDGPKCPK